MADGTHFHGELLQDPEGLLELCEILKRFRRAWARADVEIRGSQF